MKTQEREACPECGLTFKDGKRTFSTFDRPVVTLKAHLEYHAEQRSRQRELRRAMKEQNALPRVEAHQPTKALCEKRCLEAEEQTAIRLPVVVPSRMTMKREGDTAILLDELPLPLPSKLSRHRAVYGSEGFQHMPEDASLPTLRSKRSSRRSPTKRKVSRTA